MGHSKMLFFKGRVVFYEDNTGFVFMRYFVIWSSLRIVIHSLFVITNKVIENITNCLELA